MPALKPFTRALDISIDASAHATKGQLTFSFLVQGAVGNISFAPKTTPARRDELWKHTCFEAFIRPIGLASYYEFNFAPSGEWNIYAFDTYRDGMRPETRIAQLQSFSFRTKGFDAWLECTVDVSALNLNASGFRLGLTAVIETRKGEKSYWSLEHPEAKPDFHDTKGFQLEFAPAIRN